MIIIGGGPAGSAAATLLARGGKRVVLMEKEAAAHDKVCGEFISGPAAARIRELGVDLESLGAEKIARVRLINGRKILESVLPEPAFSLSRRALDEALMGKAASAGAEIRRGANVTGLYRNKCWAVQAAGDVIQADAVFVASGKHDLRGWPRRRRKGDDFIGFKMHFRLGDEQRRALGGAVEMSFLNGGYAGLEPIENGKANLCFVVKKKIFAAAGKEWRPLLHWVADKSPHLAARLREAEPLWPRPLAIYSIPYGYHYRGNERAPGLYRLGDQLAVIPSFAGEGLSLAVNSAFAATNDCLTGADRYYKDMTNALRNPLRLAGVGSHIMSSSAGRAMAFSMLEAVPAFLTRTMIATRLSH